MATVEQGSGPAALGSGRRRRASRRGLLLLVTTGGATLLVVAATVTAQALAATAEVTGPVWDCSSGTTVTDREIDAVDGPFHEEADYTDRAALVVTPDLSCEGTWAVTNRGPVPLQVRRMGFPFGGAPGPAVRLTAVAVDGRDRPVDPPRSEGERLPGDERHEVGVTDVGWLRPGESTRVAWRVVAGDPWRSCSGVTVSMAPDVRAGWGPLLSASREHTGTGPSATAEPLLVWHLQEDHPDVPC